jgi:hypothetical protein
MRVIPVTVHGFKAIVAFDISTEMPAAVVVTRIDRNDVFVNGFVAKLGLALAIPSARRTGFHRITYFGPSRLQLTSPLFTGLPGHSIATPAHHQSIWL